MVLKAESCRVGHLRLKDYSKFFIIDFNLLIISCIQFPPYQPEHFEGWALTEKMSHPQTNKQMKHHVLMRLNMKTLFPVKRAPRAETLCFLSVFAAC